MLYLTAFGRGVIIIVLGFLGLLFLLVHPQIEIVDLILHLHSSECEHTEGAQGMWAEN